MTKDKKQDSKETLSKETETPNYKNWDYPTFMKNNPNATPEEIRTFLRQKRLNDFMIFGR
jgi:hypothetical protein